ncbi:MAG: glycine zipper family protein [Methylococcales bacterium]|nr:glycine zipper family protein [Methylococcales bacterium]
MPRTHIALTAAISLLAAGCASVPSGPGVMVLPGAGKSFDQFRYDDANCRQFASFQIGGASPAEASAGSGVASAAVGTVLGAAAGAAIGGGAGGAAIGAGSGLVAGSMMGVPAAASSGMAAQQRYDAAYMQCMYAKGHQIPVPGQYSGSVQQETGGSAAANIPPPPPGSPPPPPSGAPVTQPPPASGTAAPSQ